MFCVCPWHLWVIVQDKVKRLERIKGVQIFLEVGVILGWVLPGTCGFLVCSQQKVLDLVFMLGQKPSSACPGERRSIDTLGGDLWEEGGAMKAPVRKPGSMWVITVWFWAIDFPSGLQVSFLLCPEARTTGRYIQIQYVFIEQLPHVGSSASTFNSPKTPECG